MKISLITVGNMIKILNSFLKEMSYLDDEIDEYLSKTSSEERKRFEDPNNLQVSKLVYDFFTFTPNEDCYEPLGILDDVPISFVYGFYKRFQMPLNYFRKFPAYYNIALLTPDGKHIQDPLILASSIPSIQDLESFPVIFPYYIQGDYIEMQIEET